MSLLQQRFSPSAVASRHKSTAAYRGSCPLNRALAGTDWPERAASRRSAAADRHAAEEARRWDAGCHRQNQSGTGGRCVPMDPGTRVRRTQPAAHPLGRAKAPSMTHSERDFRPNTPGAPEPDRRLAAQDGSRQEQIGARADGQARSA